MFNRSDEPIFPRKEDGAFDYGEMAMISGRKTVDVIKGVDAFLRLVTAKYVIPVMNWSTKAAADMAIKGVDGGLNLLESGKAWHANREPVERTPFVGGAFDLRVREIWADVEVAAAELPDRTKPWLIRVVYASLLASTLYGVWPDRQNADIALPPSGPVVSGPATPGGTSVPWVPRPPRTGSTERGLPEVNLDAPIANANNLSVVSVFQYVDPDDPDVPDDPRDPDGLEGGPISYYNTISHFITKMKDPNTRTEEFTLFIRNTRTNVVEEKRAALDGNMLKIPGEDIRLRRNVDGMYEIRWRGTVNRIEAFRIKQNGVTNYVVAPQESTGELRRQLSDVLDGEEDVTILHTRGHLSFGTNTDLSSVVDPGIVIYGGCNSMNQLERGVGQHYSSASFVGNTDGTNFIKNNYRRDMMMEAIQNIGNRRQTVTWRRLKEELRVNMGLENFSHSKVYLPGDENDFVNDGISSEPNPTPTPY